MGIGVGDRHPPRVRRARRVAIATASQVPDLDAEGRLLARCLRDRGVGVAAEVWDDPDVAWADYDLVVIRSTWDYPRKRDAFLQWAGVVSEQTLLANPVAMVEWTTDKRYLDDLVSAGVPIVESSFVGPGDDPHHALIDVEHVVKPTVSAGSKDTLRLSAGQRARSVAHIEAIIESGRIALIQPYLRAVDDHGETALIYFDGEFSHAIRKSSILERDGSLIGGLHAEEEIRARSPSGRELEVGAQAMAVIPGSSTDAPPLYARVDLLPGDQGDPRVLEIELAEPSLFLQHHVGAAAALTAAICRGLPGG